MEQSAKGAAAFEPGKYNGFTGYINYAGTEGYVENADFELVPSIQEREVGDGGECYTLEHVVWLDGAWLGGVWSRGHWRNGDWLDGTWLDGIWHGGTWHDGVWKDGTWLNGTWLNGTWLNGLKLVVSENPDGMKMVGLYNPNAINRITSIELRK